MYRVYSFYEVERHDYPCLEYYIAGPEETDVSGAIEGTFKTYEEAAKFVRSMEE